LREEVQSGSEQGKMLDKMMKEGQIVPGHITIGLLRRSICHLPKSNPFALVDGFPREMTQAFDFERSVTPCKMVLSFSVPDDALVARLMKRAESSGRADDNMETIKKRLRTFHSQSEPVIQYFGAVGKLQNIEAIGSVESVWAKVEPLFNTL
jgi:adenylate kinase/UMP-CMP kinase